MFYVQYLKDIDLAFTFTFKGASMGALHELLLGKTTCDGGVNLHEHIEKVKKNASEWLDGIDKNGIDHSKRLEVKLDQLIPEAFKRGLNPVEIFILLYAVYLHDIGYRDESDRIDPKDHSLRSRKYILNDPDKYFFGPFRPHHRTKMIPPIAEAVANVCFGHSTEDICPIADLPENFADEQLCQEPINLIRITALLRLADEMDQAYIRMDQGGIREHITSVEINQGIVIWHWKGNSIIGERLEEEEKKTNRILKPVNKWLSACGFPRTIIVLDPPLEAPPPPSEQRKYCEYVPKHYIEPFCHAEDIKQKSTKLLHTYTHEWLKDPNRKLLAVLGDYGIGKTSFCYKLASDLEGPKYIPVIASLSQVRTRGWQEAAQAEIDARTKGKEGEIILILDGFDELSVTFDKKTVLREIENLSMIAAPYHKVILTSRTQFFRSVYEEKDHLALVQGAQAGPSGFQRPRFERVYICPFADSQIKTYLSLCLGEKEAEQFWRNTLTKVFDMKDLASRPILIEMIVKDIEAIRNAKGTITSGRLYQVITEAWEQREQKRSEAKLPKGIMLFMEELAFYMFTREKYKLHFNTLLEAINRFFDAPVKDTLRLSLDNLDYQIRNSTFLQRNDAEGYYAFAHRSFIEYFVACKIAKEIPKNMARKKNITNEIALFVSYMITPSVYEYIEPTVGIEEPSDMVFVPSGQFIIGADDNIRISNIKESFFIDKYPVTNAEFTDFLNAMGCTAVEKEQWIDLKGIYAGEHCHIRFNKKRFVVKSGFEKHPVIFVFWHGARAYAEWADKRLPTKEEWEKAARGIDGRVYPWGNQFDRKRCNTTESGLGKTTPVNKYSNGVSPYSCYDMAGNMWEWTEDRQALHGGSWADGSAYCRCASINSYLPGYLCGNAGFRCAKSLL